MTDAARDPEFYLAHANYVRALARRLVYDPNAADDLFQEAWLAALERAPRDHSSPRRWLASVVRNLAIKNWRSSESRRARERELAPLHDSTSPDALVAHEAERRRVVEALLALEDPLRRTLIGHFFDNLSLREIAAREQLPIETVRTHFKRGLQRLRAKLVERHSNPAWFAASLRLGTPSWSSVGLRWMKGMLFVSTLKKALAVGVAIALVWFASRALSSRAEPVAASADRAREKSAEVVVAPQVSPLRQVDAEPAHDTTGAAPKAADATTGDLVVHLKSAGKLAVAGSSVRARPERSSSSWLSELQVSSDATGAARFHAIAPGDWYIESPLGASGQATVRAGATAELDLVLPRGARFFGHVRDEHGVGVAGAEILWDAGSFLDFRATIGAKSDAEGAFELRDLPIGREIELSARASYRTPTTRHAVTSASGEDVEVELAFAAAGGSLSGRVTDAHGAPVARATVVVGFADWLEAARLKAGGAERPPLYSQRTYTDERGSYRFESLPAGELPLAVGAKSFATVERTVTIEGQRATTADFTLEPSARVFGTVSGENGEPIENATVGVGRFGVASVNSTTAADGSYELGEVPLGEFEVHAEREGRGEARQKLTAAPSAQLRWDAKLSRALTLRVQVAAPGRALGGWRLEAQAVNIGESNYARNQTTDEHGVTELTNCPESPLRLALFSPSSGYFAIAVLESVDPRSGTVTIEADPHREPSASFAGRVLDVGGRAVAGANVTSFPANFETAGVTATTDDAGRFELPKVPPGSWRVGVQVAGYADRWTPFHTLTAGAKVDLGDLVLEKGGSLTVQVTAAPGVELADVKLMVMESELSLGSSEVKDGVAQFEGLATGHYRLLAYGKNVALHLVEADVKDGAESHASYRASPGSEITIAIVDEHARDISERVESRTEDAEGRVVDLGPTIPGSDGTHWIRHVGQGHFRVHLWDHVGRKAEVALDLDGESGPPQKLTATLR